MATPDKMEIRKAVKTGIFGITGISMESIKGNESLKNLGMEPLDINDILSWLQMKFVI